MKSWVLREYCFGYNDENYYVCGVKLGDTFDDREAAEAAYREAQLDYLKYLRIGEHEKIWNGDPAYVRKLDEFIQEKTGERLSDDNGYVEFDHNPHLLLSDDDLFELGEFGELHGFKLLEFDDEPVLYALWNPAEECFFKATDECFEGLVYASSRDELLSLLKENSIFVDWGEVSIEGTPESLSENPAVLKTFVDNRRNFGFVDGALEFEAYDASEVVALNALLKEPFFEVREFDLETIREEEQNLDPDDVVAGGGGEGSLAGGCAVWLAKAAAWLLVPAAIVTVVRCGFYSCDNMGSTLFDSSLLVLKWFAIGALVVIVLVFISYKIFRYRHLKIVARAEQGKSDDTS